jgi:hypothetical protein
MKSYKLKYVTYGFGSKGPKMYGVLRIKSDRGWIVEVWPCDINGSQVSDPVDWQDELGWWAAIKLFWKYYSDYDKYVNSRD